MANGAPPAPIPAATVLMLRDGPHGLEVFLLKRHGLSDVLGDAYVFPGGKMEGHDADLVDRLDQPLAALHVALGEPELSETQAAALYVAAIREVFEESGVLFGALDGARARAAWASIRQERRFDEVESLLDVPLAAAGLAPWSRWITPVASVRMRKRFDARFFVATVPPGQEPVHDDHEATESVWLRPETALHQVLGATDRPGAAANHDAGAYLAARGRGRRAD